MARQASTPVDFARSTRTDTAVTMTSGRAARVVPVAFIPMLPGDSASGRIGIDVNLAEMPRPLLNGVMLNAQAWFVPKSAHPRFPGTDEVMHSFDGKVIKALGSADRSPPPYYNTISGAAIATAEASDFFKTLGLHIPTGSTINTDLIDAFVLIYNFRLAAHSSKLTRRQYYAENAAEAMGLPRAFWPTGRFSGVVPDYERALVVGSLDLDVSAGQLPIAGLTRIGTGAVAANTAAVVGAAAGITGSIQIGTSATQISFNPLTMFAEMAGQKVVTTLADIDKARTTQAFAQLRTAYAGNDTNGFSNDDVIVAHLMRGIPVEQDEFKRPFLLDSARIPFGFAERFATDAANLTSSVSEGRASLSLSLNVPMTPVEGVIIVTVEVLPERLDERQSEEWLHCIASSDLPNPLRDVQRIEPVDLVVNRRLDAKHATPAGLYGYEPMNNKWNRAATRLGGQFYQSNPAAPFTDQRAGIWQSSIINPTFTSDHFLAPLAFPHTVFSNTTGPAFELVARHALSIVGLTQIGDALLENTDDFATVVAGGIV